MNIKKIVMVCVVAFAFCTASSVNHSFSADKKVSAIVIYVKGKVEVKKAKEKEFNPLAVNDLLYAGDTIKTYSKSQASLVMKGGAEVRLNQNSTFEISEKGKIKEIFDLTVGQLWTRMLHKRAKISVRTPAAVCAIRGTEADIEQRDLMTVKVYEGSVDVHNSAGKQKLSAGQMTTVTGANAAPESPKKMGASDIGTWQNEIDVKDIGQFVDKLGHATGDKTLKMKIQKKNGTTKDIEIKMKKK